MTSERNGPHSLGLCPAAALEVPARMFVGTAQRMYPDYVSHPARTSYERFYETDLHGYCERGLAVVLDKERDYVLFASQKNAFNSPLEIFLNCFPLCGQPAAHTLDELPSRWAYRVLQAIEASWLSIADVAELRGEDLVKVFALQHVGPAEPDGFPYSTSYRQLHWHVYGLTRQYLKTCTIERPPGRQAPEMRHTFREPFLTLYGELLQRTFAEITLDRRTSALILVSSGIDYSCASMMKPLVEVLQGWRASWRALGACFRGQTARDDRVLLDRTARQRQAEQFLDCHRYLSPRACRSLRWLAAHASGEAGSDEGAWGYWRRFRSGISGSVGVTIDLETKSRCWRVAPRTFVSTEHLGATDGTYLCRKDRTASAPQAVRAAHEQVQVVLLARLLRHFGGALGVQTKTA